MTKHSFSSRTRIETQAKHIVRRRRRRRRKGRC